MSEPIGETDKLPATSDFQGTLARFIAESPNLVRALADVRVEINHAELRVDIYTRHRRRVWLTHQLADPTIDGHPIYTEKIA